MARNGVFQMTGLTFRTCPHSGSSAVVRAMLADRTVGPLAAFEVGRRGCCGMFSCDVGDTCNVGV